MLVWRYNFVDGSISLNSKMRWIEMGMVRKRHVSTQSPASATLRRRDVVVVGFGSSRGGNVERTPV